MNIKDLEMNINTDERVKYYLDININTDNRAKNYFEMNINTERVKNYL